MNRFIQIEKFLARKLKEHCDELDKFLMRDVYLDRDFLDRDFEIFLFGNYYHEAARLARIGFSKDCEVFKNSCKEKFAGIISSIRDRGLKKIDDLAFHKHILLTVKIRKCAGGRSDKHTLLELLSEL